MKILIIGTPYSGAKILLNGISKQGYEILDEPFLQEKNWLESHPNYMNLLEYVNNSNLVVNITTFQKPKFVKDYGLFITQFTSQFDKLILLYKISSKDTNKLYLGHTLKNHKKCLQKISKIMNTELTTSEKLFSTDTLEQFETINKLELDLDAFELQSFLDPNNESYIL